LEEKYKEQPEEKKLIDEKEKLPNPTGWRMIVLPFKMREKTKGGIVLADATLEKQQVASQWISFKNGSRLLQGQRALC